MTPPRRERRDSPSRRRRYDGPRRPARPKRGGGAPRGLRKSQRVAQLSFLETLDGDTGIVTDKRDGHGAEAAREQIFERVEIALDVASIERHAGS